MKRFYFLTALLAFLLGTPVFAQVLIDQNFESGALPPGWSRQQSSPSKGWQFGTALDYSSANVTIPAHGKFAVSNDDKHDNTAATANLANRDMLITPVFSLVGYDTAQLSFQAYFTGDFSSQGTVEISTNGGSSWSLLHTLSGDSTWQSVTVDLNAYAGQANIKIAFIHNDNAQWAHAFAIDDVLIYKPSGNDVQLVSLAVPTNVLVGVVPVTITARNFGKEVLNSFQFVWSTDGGATEHVDNVNGLSIQPGQVVTLVHNTSLVLASEGTVTLNVSLLRPNGQTDNTLNNTATVSIAVALGSTEHNIVFEQHTGSWCGWCPDGSLVLQEILQTYSNVIPVTLHDSDGMSFSSADSVISAVTSSWPSGTVDRTRFASEPTLALSRDAWEQYVGVREADFLSFASVSASNVYDPTTRSLTVDVEAQFMKTISGDYRLNVFIVEDSVTGTGSGYNQRNFFRNHPNYVGHPYYSLPDPLVGYQHRYVARYFMGGAWGKTAVIPNSIAPLTPYSHTFTYTLPAGWDANSVRLVAVVQKYNTSVNDRQIINAVEMPLNGSNANVLTVAPPVAAVSLNIMIHSTCGGGMDGEIGISAIGCNDCTFTWSNGETGGYLYGVAPGTYTVTMSNTSGISVTKDFTVYGPLVLNPDITYNNSNGSVTLDVKGGTPPYTINWSNGGTGTSQSDLVQGIYEVSITDANGCASVQELKVVQPVGINNVAGSINFNVYPNPTAGNVTVDVDLANHTGVTIQVFNTIGSLVGERTITGQAQVREVVDLSAQANGIYIVKVTADGTTGVKRLVLNR